MCLDTESLIVLKDSEDMELKSSHPNALSISLFKYFDKFGMILYLDICKLIDSTGT